MKHTRTKFGISILSLLLATAFMSDAHAADYVAMNGAELYSRFCASCHGRTGQGDGPVAKSFTVEVPDLTLIARRHGGKFPDERVEKIIDGRFIIGAHGTRDMPIWGEEFIRTEIGNPDAERVTELIVKKLVEHLRSLQHPAIGAKD